MENKQTAVEWLVDKVTDMIHESNHIELVSLLEQAKRREEEREYEAKCFWFGRGINAANTNRIGELKPKRTDV